MSDKRAWFVTGVNPAMGLTTRTFGYFHTKERALKAVKRNEGEMNECNYYTHIVVENVAPGIHAYAEHEQLWFIWHKKRWVRCKTPKAAERVCNWSVG